ncbi:nuclear transport factor 2 family protein [Glaciimonas sp. PAMC28666]|uniref:nuclear transport factor 2 family protein n=1 Tax=Glaciimonas sp. PAMC28666 TaxID=2807626 RepID=UPI001F03E469|nr:nuclear transport factor 2 family protein [Glaciimonas sp. PAMC28666]
MTMDSLHTLSESTQLIHQLFYYLDESRNDDLIVLFAPEGKWHRQGQILTGRAQILQAMLQRSATQRIRHVITNGFITSTSPVAVQFVAYMTAYRFDDGTLHVGAVNITQALRLSVVRATLQQTAGVWNIAELTLTPEFEFILPETAIQSSKMEKQL